MTQPRDIEPLKAAARAKQADALARARRAIVALESRGRTINFNTVAEEAGVSKGYLYKQPDLRRAIAERRTAPPAPAPAPAPATASARSSERSEASAAHKLALATEALKRLRAEVHALREENARLRGDLAQERRKAVR